MGTHSFLLEGSSLVYPWLPNRGLLAASVEWVECPGWSLDGPNVDDVKYYMESTPSIASSLVFPFRPVVVNPSNTDLLMATIHWTVYLACKIFMQHDDVIKWKHFPRYWSFLRGIHRPITGDFPAQRPVTRSFDVFFDLRLNKRLSKQRWGWWFETQSRPVLRHCNEVLAITSTSIWHGICSIIRKTGFTTIKPVLPP